MITSTVALTDNATVNAVITGFCMSVLIAFIYGAILWRSEGKLDRHDDAIDRLEYAAGLDGGILAMRIQALADYLGVDIHDPQPDGPDEYVPEGLDAPAEKELPVLDPDDTQEFEPYPATVPTQVVVERSIEEMYAEALAAIERIGKAS